MESFLRDEVDLTAVARVAVVPFENNSKEQFAPERVRGMAITEILAQGLFDVVDKGLVDSACREEAVDLSKGPMDAGVMKRLGQRLNVQAFLMGSIDQAGDVQRGPNSYPALAMTLRLVDTHSGMIFWQASGSRTGDSLGKRLFGLGSDDEFKVALRLLRQLLSTISSERKVKLPTAPAASPTVVEPMKEDEPQAEAAPQDQPEPAADTQSEPGPDNATPVVPMGQEELLDQARPAEQAPVPPEAAPPANEEVPADAALPPQDEAPKPEPATPAVELEEEVKPVAPPLPSTPAAVPPVDESWPE